MAIHINTKCKACDSRNIKGTGRIITTDRYKNGADEIECLDCGAVDLKGRSGRPKESVNLNKFFSEHSDSLNSLTPKAIKVLKQFLNGDVKGMTAQQLLTAAIKVLETNRDLEKWQIDQSDGDAAKKPASTGEEEGVQKPLISLTAPSSNTLN